MNNIKIEDIDINKYKNEDGTMKKYYIQCPCCGKLRKSTIPLTDYGILQLHNKKYLSEKCYDC